VRLVNYLMPWLLPGLILALGVALLSRRKWLTAVLAGPALFVGTVFAPLFLPPGTTALASEASFKVMSYNLYYRNNDIAAIEQVIRQEQPDILLLQEVIPARVEALTKALADLYPDSQLYFSYAPEIGQAVASRYPVVPLEVKLESRTQKVRLETPAGPVTVWNVHANLPLPWSRQYRQLSALAQEIAGVTGPLIVGGDFNTTDQSETYRLITQHLDNAHWEAGWGFGFSFPTSTLRFVKGVPVPVAVVRIDHIFYNESLLARYARTLEQAGGSDHFPVVATLALGQ
jgi:endonuclease/exonuclease/phosphatase (EEP) superfamily protein YafD